MVISAQQNGEIVLPEPPDHVAWLLFTVFQGENRRWLALEDRELEDGLTRLWSSISMVLNGLGAKPAASSRAPRGVVRRLIDEP